MIAVGCDVIRNPVTIAVRAGSQATFGHVGHAVIVTVVVQKVDCAIAIGIDRCIEVGMCATEGSKGCVVGIEDVDHAIAISIVVSHVAIVGHVSGRWTGLNRVCDAIVVAVEV